MTFNAKTSPHPFVTMDDIHQLFSNIIEISSYNNELLSQLKERVDNWHTHQKLGDIFVTMVFINYKFFDQIQSLTINVGTIFIVIYLLLQ